jgi:hypothetical protein
MRPIQASMLLPLGPLQIDNQADRSVVSSLRVAADGLRYGSLPRVALVLDLDAVATPTISMNVPAWRGRY